jgi:hypothetical protein
MKQKAVTTVEGLLEQSLKAVNGATQVGGGLLETNTAVRLTADRTGFVTSLDNYKVGQNTLRTNQAVLRSVTATARGFERTLRDLLQSRLGTRYSAAWDLVGFKTHSLRIPEASGKVAVLLEGMKTYLTTHEDVRVTELDMTPERATGLFTTLQEALTAVDTQRGTVKALRQTRDNAEVQLRKRLRALTAELMLKLGPLDERWMAFGFNMPGAEKTPDVPEHVTARSLVAGEIEVQCDAAPRAKHYRVFTRVVGGASQDFAAVGSPTDPNLTLTGQTSGTQMEVCMSAVNNGGESAKSQVVTVTVL